MIMQNSLTVQTSPISVILLSLHPASLMHKKSPKTQNNSWHASRRTQRSINRSEDVFVEYPVRLISVGVIMAVDF